MLKSLALVVVVLAGGVVAADTISEQDQIYIVSGVLGGVCLLLTIAAIISAVYIIKLQTQVAVLQAGPRTVTDPPSNPLSGSGGGFGGDSRQQQQQQQLKPSQMDLPRSQGLIRYSAAPREDTYRAPSRERENFRMQGFNPANYIDDNRYELNGPVPPPRPYRGPSARDNYY